MGFGVPLGELMLVFVLLGLNIPRVLSRMSAAAILAPFLLWWGWGLTRLVFDAAAHGAWALRDATQLIESLYMVVGFLLPVAPRAVQRLEIGRASCRERVCQYVEIPLGALSFKKKI